MSMGGKTGWRNIYRHNMPWTEVITKDLRFAVKDLVHFVSNGFSLPTVHVHPEFPSKRASLFKIADHLGMRLTNKEVSNPSISVFYHDTTVKEDTMRPNAGSLVNYNCFDISKTKVDDVHLEIFGYNTFVDPEKHIGQLVVKSDLNAQHDGVLVSGPVNKEEGKVYQVLIDNRSGEKDVVDFRVPVIGSTIPLAYLKYKTLEKRFTNDVDRTELARPKELFSDSELKKIKSFAKSMNADFCEMDVLRDNASGQIYIVDLNTTPYGPPAQINRSDYREALKKLASAFKQEFLN